MFSYLTNSWLSAAHNRFCFMRGYVLFGEAQNYGFPAVLIDREDRFVLDLYVIGHKMCEWHLLFTSCFSNFNYGAKVSHYCDQFNNATL